MTQEEFQRRRETILRLMDDPMYMPMRARDIAMFLDIPKAKRADLDEVLQSLVEEGRIRLSKRGKYGKPEETFLQGVFSANLRGYGFVKTEGQEKDIYIAPDRTMNAMYGDTVRVKLKPGERRGEHPEGAVVEITKRANETVVGIYREKKSHGIVLPDNHRIATDIYVKAEDAHGAKTGDKVVLRLTDFYSAQHGMPLGEVSEILGNYKEPGMDMLSVVRAYDLPDVFPEEAEREAEKLERTGLLEELLAGRRDLRDQLTVTIDGEDAKDLDDAVSVRKNEDGSYLLGVHIADVSAYVREGGVLDREALKRGTSVYLPDRVLPMLPSPLSNGICSLNPGEDRLTLSCIMKIDGSGRVAEHEITESVIRSDKRLTYTLVSRALDLKDPAAKEELGELLPLIRDMAELSALLRKRRSERGAVDFDLPETKVILDSAGKPVDIRAAERNTATRIIEDFMLAANETVAEHAFWLKLPFLYRTHDKPDPEKMRELAVFVNNFGFTVKQRGGEIHPAEIRKLLEGIRGTEAESLISRITLRSMKRARYGTTAEGHFGLAAQYYTHFTSPIRRYPDLQIHRILKEALRSGITAKRGEHYDAILGGVAERSSDLERRADEAEWATVRYKKCEYMEGKIGAVSDGVISGVTAFGLFVELPNTVEGMIRVSELYDDYYSYDERSFSLVGTATGKTYRLGERLSVQVSDADRLTGTVELIPADVKVKLR